LRHIEHGSAPRLSRSSNHTFARPELEPEHLAEHLHPLEAAQAVAQAAA
jgi:hypothetical protein